MSIHPDIFIVMLTLAAAVAGVAAMFFTYLVRREKQIGKSEIEGPRKLPVKDEFKIALLSLIMAILLVFSLATPGYFLWSAYEERLARIEKEVKAGKTIVDPASVPIRPADLKSFYHGTIIVQNDTVHSVMLTISDVVQQGGRQVFEYSFYTESRREIFRDRGQGIIREATRTIEFPGISSCSVWRNQQGRICISTVPNSGFSDLSFVEVVW